MKISLEFNETTVECGCKKLCSAACLCSLFKRCSLYREKFLFCDPREKGPTTAEIFSVENAFLTNGSSALVASVLFAENGAQPCSRSKILFPTAGEEKLPEVKRGLPDVLSKGAVERSSC